jgi:hypothetical protein
MPAEYVKMRDSLKKSGHSDKEAKKIAAIAYWKKYGKSVNAAHKGSK